MPKLNKNKNEKKNIISKVKLIQKLHLFNMPPI